MSSLKTYSLLPTVVLLLACHTLNAQRERDTWSANPTIEISGQVRSAEGGVPIKNASVRVERFSGGTVDQIATDNTGKFRFTNLPRGYYNVTVLAPGFNTAQQQADLQVLFRAFLMFELILDKSANVILPEVIDARVPAAARDAYAKAREALRNKNEKEAIPHLERAIFRYPDFLEAQLLLATSHMDLRNWDKAETALNRALEIKPDSVAAVISLGEVYWRQKRYDLAEKALLEGLKLDSKLWHGYFTLGRLYWEKGDIAKAGSAVGRTLELKPDFAEAHLVAGNILLRLNQQQRALVEYQEYLRLEPKGSFAAQARELVQKLSKSIMETVK